MASRLSRKITEFLNESEDRAEKVISKAIHDWQADTVRGWPVDKGFSRASIESPSKVAKGHWEFHITAAYAGVIEYGGYPGVGPKTAEMGPEDLGDGVDINAGIYPTQRPQAPLRRALAKTRREIRETYGPDIFRRI